MADSYSVKARLSAEDSGFTSTLKSALNTTDSLASKIKSGFAFGILTGAGQKAFGMLTTGVTGLIGEINDSNAAWKTFAGNMKIIGKSESEINSVKKSLQDFAGQTVYSASDMASTYAQLAAVGTKDTDKLVKAFGGLAAASENPQQAMKTLSQQATQMAAKPQVAWADFKLMLEQTPAGIAAVAKEMGMSTSQMVTAVQDGKISTDKFFEAIKKAGGAGSEFEKMATTPKTVQQAIDGLKESVGNKLTPAFDVLSQRAIGAIEGISTKLTGIDAEGLASKISSTLDKIGLYWDAFKESFSGVGGEFKEAFSAILGGLTDVKGAFGSTESVDGFKSAMQGVANFLKSVANFATEHAGAISKLIKLLPAIVIGIKGFQVAKTVAPFVTSFASGIGKLASGGISGIAAKLFGISTAQKATGAASATAAPPLWQSALAVLALGGAVLLAAAGIALLVQSAIALSTSGWGAVAALAGLTLVIVGLAVGASILGPALTAGAVGFVAFGAAILMVGAGALLAATGMMILTQQLPILCAFGLQGAVSILALGGALAVFAVGAALAAVPLLLLSASILVIGAAVLLMSAGLLIAGVALALIGTFGTQAATGLTMVAGILPQIIAQSLLGAPALIALGAGLLAFGAGALVAGAGLIVLGAGLAVVSGGLMLLSMVLPLVTANAQANAEALVTLGLGIAALGVAALAATIPIAALGAAVIVLGAGMLVIALGATAAAGGFKLLSMTLPLLAANATKNAAALAILSAGLLAFSVGAAVAAVPILALGVAAVTLGAGLAAVGGGSMLAAMGLTMLSAALPLLAANLTANVTALLVLTATFTIFGAACAVAGAAAVVLGAGLLVTAAAVILLGSGLMLVTASLALMGGSATVAAAGVQLLAAAFMTASVASPLFMSTLLMANAPLLLIGVSALTATAGVAAFGAAMLVSAAGTLVLAAALLAVTAEMKSISKNAKSAEKSLKAMQSSVKVVESGLKTIGTIAKAAINTLISAFDGAASKVKSSGKKVAKGFNNGFKGGLKEAPNIAKDATARVNIALMSGYASAFAAGAFISQGFARGMLSQLAVIQSAAAQMAAAADKAVRAKAKIHSPSKVSTQLGKYWGMGYVGGLDSAINDVWQKAKELVAIPAIETPNLAMAYGGELSADYSYSRNAIYDITVVSEVDGREVARATASYTEEELDKRTTRNNRKHGDI